MRVFPTSQEHVDLIGQFEENDNEVHLIKFEIKIIIKMQKILV